MNTSLLRYAVTYAACGSAQKAAERLGLQFKLMINEQQLI